MTKDLTATQLANMKRAAKKLARSGEISHTEALEKLAREAGFGSWHEASTGAASSADARLEEPGSGQLIEPAAQPTPRPAMRKRTAEEDAAGRAALADYVRRRDEALARRKKAQDAGVPALRRLFEIAQTDTGQARRVAAFLLSLYNGERFPFALPDLRSVDFAIFDDCMLVLEMDASPEREVHTYFPNGGKRFEELAARWGIPDVRRLRLICETLRDEGLARGFGGEEELARHVGHALASTWPPEGAGRWGF